MPHIYQKGSREEEGYAYTVVSSVGYEGNLANHPCILEHPERFAISDKDVPEDHQMLNYSSY